MSNFHANPAQWHAIHADLAQSVCIIAGAGTGKTETLAQRYVRILRETPQIHPRHIVVLTFTEKAATEMRARIMYAVHNEQLPFTRIDMAEAQIATFHSYAARLALSQHIRLDLDPAEPFCDERLASTIAATCWELFLSHGWEEAFAHAHTHLIDSINWDEDAPGELIVQLISEIQGLAFDSTQLANTLTRTNTIDDVYHALGSALWWNFVRRGALMSERGQLDLDDIINIVPRLFAQNPTLRDSIKFLMVDEYQDTSTAQAHMLGAVTPTHDGRPSHMTVVGDPRQAIYVWRQAKVENIVKMRVQSDVPVDLVENHRSLAPILAVANASLRNYQFATTPEFDAHAKLIPATFTSSFTHQQHDPYPVQIYRYPTIHLEAHAIARRMHELHHTHGIPFVKMALLLRRRTYIDVYTAALQQAGIPFDRGKNDPFYHRTLVIDAIHVAEAMIHPHNDISLTRALLALHVTNDVALATMRMHHRHQHVWESLQLYMDSDATIASFCQLRHAFAHSQWYLEPAEWLLQLLQASGQWHRASGYEQRMLTKLINDCRALYARDVTELVHILLDRIMHEPDSASPELMTDNTSVQIMTVHAAKGLEYDAVFVADAVAYRSDNDSRWTFQPGFLLHTKTDAHQDAIDELRRQAGNEVIALWYVALTRAKFWLMISAYQQSRERSNLFNELFEYVTSTPIDGVLCDDINDVVALTQPATQQNLHTPIEHRAPITGQRMISLSPTALHEIMQCPRRYRFLRRCGMSDVADAHHDNSTEIGIHTHRIQSQYQLPIPPARMAQPADDDIPVWVGSESYQSVHARTLGTLFHAALELHASQGPHATAETLCHAAMQRYARPVSQAATQELHELVAKYMQSPLAHQIPTPQQVEQSLYWQYVTPSAHVEVRCIIDRFSDTQIIDYKTDYELDDIAAKHGDQLRINALALQQVAPDRPLPALAVYHARSGHIVPIDSSPAAMDATKAHIAAAAHLIVTGSFPAKPQRGFCQHCPALPLCPEGNA